MMRTGILFVKNCPWKRSVSPSSSCQTRTMSTQSPPASPSAPVSPKPAPPKQDLSNFLPDISVEDFLKTDIRVAKIVQAEVVKGSNKLLKIDLELSLPGVNEKGEAISTVVRRTVLSGIKSAYGDPSKLIGKHTLYLANIPPRKMGNFGVSQGMILAASGTEDSSGIFLAGVDAGAVAGFRVR